jgi:hypothetical protein
MKKHHIISLIVVGAVAAATLLALGTSATASPSKARTSKDVYIDFRLPSNNIFCAYISSTSPRYKYLRCDIMSGLKPKPSSAGCVEGSRGFSAVVNVTGRASYTCASDTVYNKSAPRLNYGRVWSRGGITCWSKKTGLRCKNRSSHGFFLSRKHSYRF